MEHIERVKRTIEFSSPDYFPMELVDVPRIYNAYSLQFHKLFGEFEISGVTLKEEDGEYSFGSIFLKFPSKMTGIIDFGMGLRGPSYSWSIVGKEGAIIFDRDKGNELIFEGEKKETIPLGEKGIDDTKSFIDGILLNFPSHIPLKESRKAIEISILASKLAKK